MLFPLNYSNTYPVQNFLRCQDFPILIQTVGFTQDKSGIDTLEIFLHLSCGSLKIQR